MLEKTLWEQFLEIVEPHLPEYLHWNEICWTIVYYLAEARRHIHRWCRGMEAWEIVVNTVTYCFYVWLVTEILRWVIGWAFFHEKSLLERTKKGFFFLIRRMPFLKEKIANEMQQTLDKMGREAFPVRPGETFHMTLPAKGMKEKELMKEIDEYLKLCDVKWQEGRVSGAVYCGGKELTDMLTKVHSKFTWANPLHADIFPDVRKMEAEVVQMCVNLFRGGKDACGTMTSGGTESILMACKAYRDWLVSVELQDQRFSIHAAFDKAAHYFDIKLVHVPVDEKTRKCNLKAMRRAITKNTIVICGSAPQFPHGVIDPIVEMSKLAKKYNVGLHVDACLGGFLIPFMKKAGFDIPPFDFTLEGVTSISCDTHKYGFSPKGSSVIMYRNKELRHFQFFVAPDWQGGIYACPSIPGSRPGAIIAATWASLMYFGESGMEQVYVDSCKENCRNQKEIEEGLRKIKGIYVLGKPEVSIVAFGSNDLDIYRLYDALTKRNWHLNSLQFPASIHICVTYLNTQEGVADLFVKEVGECVAELLKGSSNKTSGMAAIYGMSQAFQTDP
ncbi:Sphingosine-1-phosphate lyase 1 [Desmophyllum pertusum]|uniref:sphinganine-1-phosphate aldolase n=1 Tax=Desmophyllum pertusum TaxID=174260 RepID=A0A9X0CZ92_9CNID|nr:Sphingosine-1-phosphate lyase 1 [Desmophyllum pertusum]